MLRPGEGTTPAGEWGDWLAPADAWRRVRDVWRPADVGQEGVPLAEACGRVLAQDVQAPLDSPGAVNRRRPLIYDCGKLRVPHLEACKHRICGFAQTKNAVRRRKALDLSISPFCTLAVSCARVKVEKLVESGR